MLPRRGYEPVDDGDDVGNHEGTRTNGGGRGGGLGGRSAYTSIPTQNLPLALEDRLGREGFANGADPQNGGVVTVDNAAHDGATARRLGSGDGGDSEMTVRILDVQGQSYSLDVRPETTVRELKGTLVDVAGVEMSRQRIIWGGKVGVSMGDAGGLKKPRSDLDVCCSVVFGTRVYSGLVCSFVVAVVSAFDSSAFLCY